MTDPKRKRTSGVAGPYAGPAPVGRGGSGYMPYFDYGYPIDQRTGKARIPELGGGLRDTRMPEQYRPTTPIAPPSGAGYDAAAAARAQQLYTQQPWTPAMPSPGGMGTGINSGTPGMGPQYGQPETYPGSQGMQSPYANPNGEVTPPTSAGGSWPERFYAEHGRYPNEEDEEDRRWSEQFYGVNGRPPNLEEWTWHYYQKYPTSQAGGGAGNKPVETLGNLSWWASAESLPANLRGWGAWLREFVEQNKGVNISNPFYRTGQAGLEPIQDVNDKDKPLAGYNSTNEILEKLRQQLGVQVVQGDNNTTVWQKIVNAMPAASIETQQLLNSLRYDSNTNQWYSVDTNQLVNPQYT